MDESRETMTAKEVQSELQVARSTLNNMIARGDVPAPFYLGGVRRWHRETFRQWVIDQQTQQVRVQGAIGNQRMRGQLNA